MRKLAPLLALLALLLAATVAILASGPCTPKNPQPTGEP